MKSLTAAEMREADRRCIEELGIPGAVLMNNAGAAVFKCISQGPVGVVCGKGNNGGDGFVVARLALLAGHETAVVLLAAPDELNGDALVFMEIYRRLGGQIISVADEPSTTQAVDNLANCFVLVDAMLGTGITGEVHGKVRAAIDAWPPGIRTIAVDLPSGLHTDTGEPLGACVRAALTVTFQFPKRGFDNAQSADFTGEVIVADIGIPAVCADDSAWSSLKHTWVHES